MSVVELRALLRCYPIGRTALPAPIELLRRDELLAFGGEEAIKCLGLGS
jgi:hypothetical protein